jgi:hypothetical protein
MIGPCAPLSVLYLYLYRIIAAPDWCAAMIPVLLLSPVRLLWLLLNALLPPLLLAHSRNIICEARSTRQTNNRYRYQVRTVLGFV